MHTCMDALPDFGGGCHWHGGRANRQNWAQKRTLTQSKRKLKWTSTSGSPIPHIKSENRTCNRSYNFLILTENNLSNIFKHAYEEGKNHAVQLEQCNDCLQK